ncbi:MAG: hypothetical protein HY000_28255 [Planctomycetes bacterium]|nr:hypothetical protein [Planctomycetota bacterium]
MSNTMRIAIIGDYNPGNRTHRATNDGIRQAADFLAIIAEINWLPTPTLVGPEAQKGLEQFDGLWASPGSPYQSKEGALAAIRFARERDWPFVGT